MDLYAWWSQKQFLAGGSVVYRRADGQEVEATMVSKEEDHGAAWDDIVYLGIVEEFVSSSIVSYPWEEDPNGE